MRIRPRAVFIEGAIVDAIGTCLAASMSLLASWCVVKAREHTSAPGHLAGYNSSACAVSAIWLMFNVWCVQKCLSALYSGNSATDVSLLTGWQALSEPFDHSIDLM